MSAWQPMLERLVAERYARLVARARLLAGPDGDPEDLVQEALVATFAARARFESVAEAEQYVRRAIASRMVDRARRGVAERASFVRLAARPPAVAEPGTGTDRVLLRALAELPPRQRACVVLRHLDDLSVRQTGQALGLSEGAVKRYTSEGVASLGARLGVAFAESETTTVRIREVPRG